MNDLNNRRLVMLDSVTEFGKNHTLNPAIARVTVLYGLIAANATTLRNLGATQVEGRGGVRSAASESVILRGELLGDLRAINKIARALPVAEFPGMREQFRMPTTYAYQAVANAARAFIANATPLSQVFVERGRPATFLEDLNAVLAAFDASRLRKQAGRHEHVGSTAGLEVAGRQGVAAMRELDAILSPIYEPNPTVFAAWKAATQIERAPQPVTETTPPAAATPTVTTQPS
jgi:hypothetical protein